MTASQFRWVFGSALLIGALGACPRPAPQQPVGPELGTSTAQGPADPRAPLAKPERVTEVSAKISAPGNAPANPAPSGTPPFSSPSGGSASAPITNQPSNDATPAAVYTPGVIAGPTTPVNTGTTASGVTAAGTTGTGATATAPATTSSGTNTGSTVGPGATAPSGGPGTGNAPVTPTPPGTVTPTPPGSVSPGTNNSTPPAAGVTPR